MPRKGVAKKYDPREGVVHRVRGQDHDEANVVYSKEELRAMPQRDVLTARQMVFVEAYLRLKKGYEAALEAGYSESTARVMGRRLLDETYYPLVARAVKDGLRQQMQHAILDGAAVLRYIHTIMTFCPADWFAPAGDDGWVIDLEEYRVLPAEIRQIIEHMELRNVELPDGTKTSSMWVKFVSKTTAMGLAAKYQLGDKNQDNQVVQQIDWSLLFGRQPLRKLQLTVETTPAQPDEVERKILQLEAKTVPPTAEAPDGSQVHSPGRPQGKRPVPARPPHQAGGSEQGGNQAGA